MMILENILSISGKQGLYKLLSNNKHMIIVEMIGQNKRMPVHNTEQVVALSDVAMYTYEEEIPLREIMASLFEVMNEQKIELNIKNASKDELFEFFGKVLPEFDRDRVHASDIKKLIQWYNLLLENGEITVEKIKELEELKIKESEEKEA
ncbi:MAG: DUF5606 domain-containing protein [Bacteroidaceae bacterium]